MHRLEHFSLHLLSLLSRYAATAGALVLAAYIAAIGTVSWVAPASNWDMVAYAATVLETRTGSIEETHAKAYAAVRDRVSEGEYLAITSGIPYRVAQSRDPASFATMLGFYRVKAAYIRIASWLSNSMQPVDALRAISTVSFFAIGALVVAWAASRRLLAYGPLIVALLVLCGLGQTARIVTPDLFAAFFVIGALLLFVRGNDVASAIVMFAACLARPDHLALSATLLVAAIFFRRGIVPQAVAFLAAGLATAWIAASSGHPGWWAQHWFSYVEYVPTLEGFHPPFSIARYLMIIVEVIVRSLTNETWMAIAIVEVAAALILLARGWRPERRMAAVLSALLLCELGKLFVAPQAESRTHVGYLVVGGLLVIEAVAMRLRETSTASGETRLRPVAALDAV